MSERLPLSTVFGEGKLEAAFTSSTHIFVTTTGPATVTINRVEYRPSAHFYKWKDGRFHLGYEDRNIYARRESLYMHRPYAGTKQDGEPASESARAKFLSEVELAVNNFVVNNPVVLIDAEIENRREEVRQAASDYKETAKEMNKAKNLLIEAEKKLDEYLVEVGR